LKQIQNIKKKLKIFLNYVLSIIFEMFVNLFKISDYFLIYKLIIIILLIIFNKIHLKKLLSKILKNIFVHSSSKNRIHKLEKY